MITIASIFYKQLECRMPYRPTNVASGGFVTEYRIPASDDRQPRILRVEVVNEKLGDVNGMPITSPISAESLADSLVALWSHGGEYSGYGGPGVWKCRGEMPAKDEVEAAMRRQSAWCAAGINEAQNLWIAGKRDQVLDHHRDMARWMGKTDFEWVKPHQAVNIVACPYCGGEIPDNVAICRHCGNVANPKLKAELDQRVADMMAGKVVSAAPEVAEVFAMPPELELTGAAPTKRK